MAAGGGYPGPYGGPYQPRSVVPPVAPAPVAVVRVEPVPGTPFGVLYPAVNPTVAGLAIGSMVAGIGAVLVTLVVFCFGLVGSGRGWGGLVAGAFAILALLLAAGAAGTGQVALRQVRASAGQVTGRGMAVTGLVCAASAVVLAFVGFVVAAAVT